MDEVPSSPAQPRARLVLLHGTRMSRAQWEPYRALLPEIDLVTADLPGHGERVGEDFTREAALATVDAALAQARAWDEGADRAGDPDEGALRAPVVLAGHSLGGYLATMWAAEHPGEIDGLVLVGASADPAGPLTGIYRGFARAMPHVDPQRLASGMNAVMRRLGARGEHAAALPDGAAYAALPAAWQLVIDEAGPDLLGEVDCPVVLVNGQLDQMRVHVRRFAAATRDAHVITIPRATHLLPATHPEQLAEILRDAVGLARGGDVHPA